jgi:hypothetical protein
MAYYDFSRKSWRLTVDEIEAAGFDVVFGQGPDGTVNEAHCDECEAFRSDVLEAVPKHREGCSRAPSDETLWTLRYGWVSP